MAIKRVPTSETDRKRKELVNVKHKEHSWADIHSQQMPVAISNHCGNQLRIFCQLLKLKSTNIYKVIWAINDK